MCLSLIWCSRSFAQDNLLFTINSAGGYSNSSGQLYDFNVGEMVLINTFTVGAYHISQGFLQPHFLNDNIGIPDDLIRNNVITPNGDGKNDLFVLQGLDGYPGNKLKIYDRSGRIIYSVTNYKNDWNGMVNGKLLNEDTYYFVLDLGKNWPLIRGFISIIHDLK
jgi:gliding motility-associated-like protein